MGILGIRESKYGNSDVKVGGEGSDVNDEMRRMREMEFDGSIYRPKERG